MTSNEAIPYREALRDQVAQLARQACDEDLGRGDITSMLLGDRGEGRFHVLGKQAGVFAGCEVAPAILDAFPGDLRMTWAGGIADGMVIAEVPMVLGEIDGSVDAVLTAERTLLNFLQRLCGIATLTRCYVDAIAGTGAAILDTRKTTPGWRYLEKYAVRCGGGRNHRIGLHDAILIKDNHLAGVAPENTAAAVFDMLNRAADLDPPPAFVEVEADHLTQVEQLFRVVGIDVILLDNFSLADLCAAVSLRASLGLAEKVKLEASGGVTLDTVRGIAETGVDYISVGAVTHSATALDLSLERAV